MRKELYTYMCGRPLHTCIICTRGVCIPVYGGCTEPAELARKAAEQPAEWAAENEGGQPRNTRLVTSLTVYTKCRAALRYSFIGMNFFLKMRNQVAVAQTQCK